MIGRAGPRRVLYAGKLGLIPCVLAAWIATAQMGCAHAPSSSSDWIGEIPRLAAEVEANPMEPEVWYRLGVAHEFSRQPGEAIAAFQKALERDSSHEGARLGAIRLNVEIDRLDQAEMLLAGLGQGDTSEFGASARRLVDHGRLRARMKSLAQMETGRSGQTVVDGTIGVVDFSENDDQSAVQGFGKALTAIVTTELSKLEGVRVLERQNLQILLDEMERTAPVGDTGNSASDSSIDARLGLSPVETLEGVLQRLALLRPSDDAEVFYTGPIEGESTSETRDAIRAFQAWRGLGADGIPGPRTQRALASAVTELTGPVRPDPVPAPTKAPSQAGGVERFAPQAGRMLGARHLLGGWVAVGNDRVETRGRVVDSTTGALVTEELFDAPLSEFFRLPGEIVLRTASALDIPMDDATIRDLQSLPPATKSLAAFLAFGRGLEHEDQGRWREASEEYATALRLSPEFAVARGRVEGVKLGSASFEQSLQRSARSVNRARRVSRATERAMGSVGAGTEANAERSDEENPSRAVQTDGGVFGSVRVRGQIPVEK